MHILSVLLDITNASDSVSPAVNVSAVSNANQGLSFLDLIAKGGPIMIPIGILSVLTFYIFFERLFTIQKASKIDPGFIGNIKQHVYNGNLPAAIALCQSSKTPVSRMVEKGLKRLGKPLNEIREGIEDTAKLELYNLEKNVGWLGTIAGIAPLFGFLGTIFGVIKIFYNIALADNISIGLIAGGLYEKMITSAAGLMIGIIAFIGHHILIMMIDKTVNKMEISAVDFVDLLQEPTTK